MPEPHPVVNATPLLILGRLGLLELVGSRLVVPLEVAEEVRAHSDEASRALEDKASIEVAPREPILDVVSGWDLGAGGQPSSPGR
ncbi:MAG: hypothetical protein RL885_04175 [Planctomycetota bacterium]